MKKFTFLCLPIILSFFICSCTSDALSELNIRVVSGLLGTPVILPEQQTLFLSSEITILPPPNANDAFLYYTIDGSDPDETSFLYGGPFLLPQDLTSDWVTIKAVAKKVEYQDSVVVVRDYKVENEIIEEGKNANLSSFTLSAGSLSFQKNITTYFVSIAHATSSLEITYETEDPEATAVMTPGNPIPLVVGKNLATITVTSPDGSCTKNYTVEITREKENVVPKSNNADLSSLSLSSGTLTFDKDTVSYSVSVENAASSLVLNYTLADPKASAVMSPSNPIALSVGSNIVTIVVTAEDGNTVKEYTLRITREKENAVPKSNNADLSSLSLSSGTLTFDKDTVSYSVSVENAAPSLVLNYTLADLKASVVMSPSNPIALSVGSNPVTITVTAEDGTVKIYTVNITRASAGGNNNGSSFETDYYATNPNGQVGKYKTITSFSDWSSDMIIAQGTANDDPRVFSAWSMHENPFDAYAMFAAYDDTNLYLLLELPNVQDVVAPGENYPLSDNGQYWNRGTTFQLVFYTGKRVIGDGSMTAGEDPYVWKNQVQYMQGIDTMLIWHSHPEKGTPGFFITNESGKFSYKVPYLDSFTNKGVKIEWEQGLISKKLWGIKNCGGNNGRLAENLSTDLYYDFLTDSNHNTNTQDLKYQVTIPLASLGVTKAELEANGVGVMFSISDGASAMQFLPYDPAQLDNAAKPYSNDESTSAEKEDLDSVTMRLASIGNIKGGR